jgi:WD40 repeat protein
VKSDSKKAESTTAPKLTESKLSDSDEYAIKQGKLEEVIAQTQRQYQNDT